MVEEEKKYKLTALTNVGRTGVLKQGDEVIGSMQDIYKTLERCFINGCELGQEGNTINYKVYAGWGSHVADVQIEEIKQ